MQASSLPRMGGMPCWAFPILAGLAWLITLLSILIEWVVKGSPHYPEMLPTQHLAYISNAGASTWGRPLFITGSTVTAILFSVTFFTERWLRHKGRLLHTTRKWAAVCWVIAAIITFLATCALILFTIFCVRSHPIAHYSLVATFAIGYIIAASLMCIEKWHLCHTHPSNNILRRSLTIKVFFIGVEIALVVAGSITMYQSMYRSSVVIEWVAAFFFSFYMASFAIDFLAVPEDTEKGDVVYMGLKARDDEAGISRPKRLYRLKHREYDVLP